MQENISKMLKIKKVNKKLTIKNVILGYNVNIVEIS